MEHGCPNEVESKVIKGLVELLFQLTMFTRGAQSSMSLRRRRESEKQAKKLQNHSKSRSLSLGPAKNIQTNSKSHDSQGILTLSNYLDTNLIKYLMIVTKY